MSRKGPSERVSRVHYSDALAAEFSEYPTYHGMSRFRVSLTGNGSRTNQNGE
jgi:hypothetical protein